MSGLFPTRYLSLAPRQRDGAVKRDDRLAGAGGTRYPRRAAVGALDQAALRRVQEDRPFLPRIVQRPFQFLEIGQNAEPALRIGMLEPLGVNSWRDKNGPARPRL